MKNYKEGRADKVKLNRINLSIKSTYKCFKKESLLNTFIYELKFIFLSMSTGHTTILKNSRVEIFSKLP